MVLYDKIYKYLQMPIKIRAFEDAGGSTIFIATAERAVSISVIYVVLFKRGIRCIIARLTGTFYSHDYLL